MRATFLLKNKEMTMQTIRSIVLSLDGLRSARGPCPLRGFGRCHRRRSRQRGPDVAPDDLTPKAKPVPVRNGSPPCHRIARVRRVWNDGRGTIIDL